MLEKREDVRGRALLVGLNCPGLAGFDNSDTETMDELDELVQTAGGVLIILSMLLDTLETSGKLGQK